MDKVGAAIDALGRKIDRTIARLAYGVLAGIIGSTGAGIASVVVLLLVRRVRRELAERAKEVIRERVIEKMPEQERKQPQQRKETTHRIIVDGEKPTNVVEERREYVKVEKPNGELEALRWALKEWAKRYPGDADTIMAIESLAEQYLAGLRKERRE